MQVSLLSAVVLLYMCSLLPLCACSESDECPTENGDPVLCAKCSDTQAAVRWNVSNRDWEDVQLTYICEDASGNVIPLSNSCYDGDLGIRSNIDLLRSRIHILDANFTEGVKCTFTGGFLYSLGPPRRILNASCTIKSVSECKEHPAMCHLPASCANTGPGQCECQCAQGYEGDSCKNQYCKDGMQCIESVPSSTMGTIGRMVSAEPVPSSTMGTVGQTVSTEPVPSSTMGTVGQTVSTEPVPSSTMGTVGGGFSTDSVHLTAAGPLPTTSTLTSGQSSEVLALSASLLAILFVVLCASITIVFVMICHWKKKRNRLKSIPSHLQLFVDKRIDPNFEPVGLGHNLTAAESIVSIFDNLIRDNRDDKHEQEFNCSDSSSDILEGPELEKSSQSSVSNFIENSDNPTSPARKALASKEGSNSPASSNSNATCVNKQGDGSAHTIPSGATIASGNTTEDSKPIVQSAATSQTCSIVIEPDMTLDCCHVECSLPIPQISSKSASVTQQGTNPSRKWIPSDGYTSESAVFSQGAQKIPTHIPDMEKATPTFTLPNVQALTGIAKKSNTILCNGEVSLQMNTAVDFRPTAVRCPEPKVTNQSLRSGYVEDGTHSPCPLPCNEDSIIIPMMEGDLRQSPGAGMKPPTFTQQKPWNATCIRLPHKDAQQRSLVQGNTAKRTQNHKLFGDYDSEKFISRSLDTHNILRVGKEHSSHMYKTAPVVAESLPSAPTVTNIDCISAPLPVHMKPATMYTTSSSMAAFNQSSTGGYTSEGDNFLVPLLPEEHCTLTPSQPLQDPLFVTEWEEEEFNTEYDHTPPPSELSLSDNTRSNTGYAQHIFTAVASSTTASETVVASESPPPVPTVISTNCLSTPLPAHPSSIQPVCAYTTSSSMAPFNQYCTGGYTSKNKPKEQCTLNPSNNTSSNTGYAQHVFTAGASSTTTSETVVASESLPPASLSSPLLAHPSSIQPASTYTTSSSGTPFNQSSTGGYTSKDDNLSVPLLPQEHCTLTPSQPLQDPLFVTEWEEEEFNTEYDHTPPPSELSLSDNTRYNTGYAQHNFSAVASSTTASETVVASESLPPAPTVISTDCLFTPLPAHPSSIQPASAYTTSSSMAPFNQSSNEGYTSEDDNFSVPLLPEEHCTLTPSQPLQDPLFITEWEEEEFNTEYDHTPPPSELSLSGNTRSNTGYAPHIFTTVASSTTASETVVASESPPPAPTVISTNCLFTPLPAHPSSIQPASAYTTSSSMAPFNQNCTGGYTSKDEPEEQCTLNPCNNTRSNTGYAQHVFTAGASSTTASETVVVLESLPPAPTVVSTNCLSSPLTAHPSSIQPASTYTTSSSGTPFTQSSTGGYTSKYDNFSVPLLPEEHCTLTPSQPFQDPLFVTEWEEEEFNTEYDHTPPPSELSLSDNTRSNTGYAQHIFSAVASSTTTSETAVVSESPPPAPTVISTNCLSTPLPAHASSIQSASTYTTSSSMAAFNQSSTGGYTSEDDNFLVPLLPEEHCTLTPSQPLQDPLFVTEWEEEEFNTEYDHTSPPSEFSLSGNTRSNTGYAPHIFTTVASSTTASETVVASESLPPAPTVVSTDCLFTPLPAHPSSIQPASAYTTSSSMAPFNQNCTGGYTSKDEPEEQCTLNPSNNTRSNTGYAQHVFTAGTSSTTASETIVASESLPPAPTVISTHCLFTPLPAHPSSIQPASAHTTSSSMAPFNQSSTEGYTSEDDNFSVRLLPEEHCTLTPSQPLQDPLFITEWEEEEFNTEYDHTPPPSELSLSDNTRSTTAYAPHIFTTVASSTTASETVVASESLTPAPTVVSANYLFTPLPAHPSSIQPASTYTTSSSMAAFNQSSTGGYTSEDDNFSVPLLPEEHCTLTPSQPLQDPLFVTEWEEEEFNTEYDHTPPPSELSLSDNTRSTTGYAQHVFTAVASSTTASETVVASESLTPAPTVVSANYLFTPLPAHPSSIQPASTYTTSSSMAAFNQSSTGGYTSEDDNFSVPLLPEEHCTLTPSQPLQDPLFVTEWEEEEFNTEYDHTPPPSELSLSDNTRSTTGYAQHVFTAVASSTTASETVVFSESPPPAPTVISTNCLSTPLPAHPSSIQPASAYTTSSSMAAFNQSSTGGYTSEDDNFLVPLLSEEHCTLTPSQPLQDPLFITEWEEEEFNTEYDPSELSLSDKSNPEKQITIPNQAVLAANRTKYPFRPTPSESLLDAHSSASSTPDISLLQDVDDTVWCKHLETTLTLPFPPDRILSMESGYLSGSTDSIASPDAKDTLTQLSMQCSDLSSPDSSSNVSLNSPPLCPQHMQAYNNTNTKVYNQFTFDGYTSEPALFPTNAPEHQSESYTTKKQYRMHYDHTNHTIT